MVQLVAVQYLCVWIETVAPHRAVLVTCQEASGTIRCVCYLTGTSVSHSGFGDLILLLLTTDMFQNKNLLVLVTFWLAVSFLLLPAAPQDFLLRQNSFTWICARTCYTWARAPGLAYIPSFLPTYVHT